METSPNQNSPTDSAEEAFSESFESLSEGFQNAVWQLGGLPERHRTDRMSLAVNNASNAKEFTERYTSLLGYYGMAMEKIQPEEPNENGDAEQSHRRFKEAVEQALLLRGSRDFESRAAYGRFLDALTGSRNAGRRKRLDDELPRLLRLPERRRESYKRIVARVDRGSMIHVDRNAYSGPSRLIGERVEARLYVDRRENLLLFGKTGTGKTHLLSAIAQELVRTGRKVLFWPCSLLVQELLLAKRDLKLSRVLKRFAGFEALVIDDLGYVQQSREEMEVLFTLLAERYERGTVMLTSNLPFSKWEAIFKDPMTTAAAIDRLVHHSVILELNIASYRLEAAKRAKPPEAA